MKTLIENAINLSNVKNYSDNIDTAIDNAKKDIVEQAKKYKNNTLSSQTGFVAESVHVGSFNIDSAFKRSSLKAVKEKNGFHGDYKVLDGKKIVAKGEFKHYNNAQQTENAMRGYDNRDLVGPSDQMKEVKDIAKRKALKNKTTRPDVAKEHQKVYKKSTDSIKKDNVSSKPKTLKKQKKITKKATKGKVDSAELLPDFKDSVKSAAIGGAIEGAKTGAIFGGGMSAISNFIDVIDGKKDTEEAVKDVAIETVKSTADCAIKNVAGSVAKATSTHLAQKVASQGVKRVMGSAAPIIVATVLVDTCKDVYKCANGEIDGETVVKNTGKNVATAGGAWAGAEGGAVVGAMVGGPAGAVIGGFIGGVAGALGISSLFD